MATKQYVPLKKNTTTKSGAYGINSWTDYSSQPLIPGASYGSYQGGGRTGLGENAIYNYKGQRLTAEEYNRKLNDIYGGYSQAIQKLQGEYQGKYDEAKEANEQRYGDILSGYDQMRTRGERTIDAFGNAAKTTVRDQYRGAKAHSKANLARSGALNSTLSSTADKSFAKQQAKDLNAVSENVAGKKLDYSTSVEQNKLGVMERRQDDYPNQQLYQQQMSSIYESATKSGVPVEQLLEYMTLGL